MLEISRKSRYNQWFTRKRRLVSLRAMQRTAGDKWTPPLIAQAAA
jgi:hypothetical protein